MWNHFLIKIEWLDELFNFIESNNITKWSELFRELSIYTINRHYAWRSFQSFKKAFYDYNLAEERDDDNLILIPHEKLKNHLETVITEKNPKVFDIFNKSWRQHDFTDFHIWEKLGGLNYPETKRARIYTQQIELLKFMGLGIISEKNRFIPFTKIHLIDEDSVQLMKLILKYEDPRILGYKYSHHPERDCLLYTQGRNFLPLTDNYSPEISFVIKDIFTEKGKINADGIMEELSNFSSRVYSASGFIDIREFDNFIFTLKFLLDNLFFNKMSLLKTTLDSNTLDFFEDVLNKYGLKITAKRRREYSVLFESISSLFYNSIFFNRYLHRPSTLFSLSQNLESKVSQQINRNFKMMNKRISFSSLCDSFKSLRKLSYQTEMKIRGKNLNSELNKNSENYAKFLTGEIFERRDLLNKLKEDYFISAKTFDRLIHFKPVKLNSISLKVNELKYLIELFQLERFMHSKAIIEIQRIKEFLEYKYLSNLKALGLNNISNFDHLDKFNLRQFLNILADQKMQLERHLKYKYNKDLFEHLSTLIINSAQKEHKSTDPAESELRYSLEKLLNEYKGVTY